MLFAIFKIYIIYKISTNDPQLWCLCCCGVPHILCLLLEDKLALLLARLSWRGAFINLHFLPVNSDCVIPAR